MKPIRNQVWGTTLAVRVAMRRGRSWGCSCLNQDLSRDEGPAGATNRRHFPYNWKKHTGHSRAPWEPR